jgi:hypothetical protein
MNKQRKVTVQSIYDFLSSSLIGQKVVEVLKAILLFRNFYFDFRRSLKWSFANNKISTETNLRALITMDYHRLEKGLALTQPKVGFGRDVIERLSHYLLSYQNGNRGFGDRASKVLIVASNLEHFASVGERYQGWIDGGMFAMSLFYALHSLGLGTCCLNWCVKHAQDRNLKESAGIAESDLVIMMIVVGHLPEEFKVAQSPRKPIHEVLIFPDSQNYMLSCSKTKS